MEVKGVPFDRSIFFRIKVGSVGKNCRSFPQLLRKLSSVPQDHKMFKVTFRTRKEPKKAEIKPKKSRKKTELLKILR